MAKKCRWANTNISYIIYTLARETTLHSSLIIRNAQVYWYMHISQCDCFDFTHVRMCKRVTLYCSMILTCCELSKSQKFRVRKSGLADADTLIFEFCRRFKNWLNEDAFEKLEKKYWDKPFHMILLQLIISSCVTNGFMASDTKNLCTKKPLLMRRNKNQ